MGCETGVDDDEEGEEPTRRDYLCCCGACTGVRGAHRWQKCVVACCVCFPALEALKLSLHCGSQVSEIARSCTCSTATANDKISLQDH